MEDLNARSAELAARKISKRKGVRFRHYARFGIWPIKAYGYLGSLNGEVHDFQTWGEALDWIQGV